MAVSQDEVFQKVKEVLVDALGVDEDEVTPKARLMADLGAESIDFLDIVFRLEKTFGIKIAREELFPAEGLLSSSELVVDGRLTEKGLGLLKKQLPHVDMAEFQKDPVLAKLGDLFTVAAIVKFLSQRVGAGK
jgi:acyl carrier protein